MTIKEKMQSLGLTPEQTIAVTMLLIESYATGVSDLGAQCRVKIPSMVMCSKGMKILDTPHLPPPMPINREVFESVFDIDLGEQTEYKKKWDYLTK